MTETQPTRQTTDLADVLELLLDKGIVINADIVVSIGETELLGVELRAAIASFETAAEYGLEFPAGTDMRRVEQASGRPSLDESAEPIDAMEVGRDRGDDEDGDDSSGTTSSRGAGRRGTEHFAARPVITNPTEAIGDPTDDLLEDDSGDDTAEDGGSEGGHGAEERTEAEDGGEREGDES